MSSKELSMCKLVSIIVPCYNCEKFIKETLFSILSQTYRNIEVICIDDGSKDHTRDVVLKVQTLDSRVNYIYQDNTGVAIARNNAIAKAQGYYILPIDSDDLGSSNFVECLVNCIEKTGCDVATPHFYKFENPFDMQKFLLRSPSKFRMASDNVLVCSSLFRKEDFIKLGGFDHQTFAKGFEDYDLWLNFINHGFKIVRAKDAFCFYRQHSDGSSFNAGALAVMNELNEKLKNKYPNITKYQRLNKIVYIFTNFSDCLRKLNESAPHWIKRYLTKLKRFVIRKNIKNAYVEYKIFKVIQFKRRIYEF